MEKSPITESYTTAELASALKVSTRTVRRWIVAGDLQAINIGTPARAQVRITEPAIRAFVKSRAEANGSANLEDEAEES